MGELKSKMVNHVRSAQKWLHRAEVAFESEKDTRGKLDLMLANAEMQHLHESAIKGKSFSLIKQAVAFSCAAVLFSSGIGGAYFYFHHKALQQENPIQTAEGKLWLPIATTPQVFLEPSLSAPQNISNAIAENTHAVAVIPSSPQPTSSPSPKEESARVQVSPLTADRENVVSQIVRPEEMQKLIRAAGKSLRGQ
jgi:hypothetical protein